MDSMPFLLCLTLVATVVSCKPAAKPSAPSSSSPAKVITENDLTTITLKPEAEQRLGIATATLEKQKVARNRALGGELLLPLGRAGTSTNEAKSIYSLLPAMTPTELVRAAEMQVDAEGQVKAGEVQLEAAKIALARAESLLANKSGTQRVVDDARAQVQLAEAALQTARERRALLGAPLFNAVQQDLLWVRVPVYVGDLNEIKRDDPARVTRLGHQTNSAPGVAKPVAVPISSASASATVDLFYELENSDGKFRPGERVSVALPMQGEQEHLIAPAASVLYDIHGGTWVYENIAAHTFMRRRIEVRYIDDGKAVLARGPQPGTKVVTTGAAELFGTEFGIGK